MRIAIFGGAFDPVHNGHLAIAREARRAFGLDRVLLTPAGNPPHKRTDAPFADRLRMAELAVEGMEGVEASDLEAGEAPSYSIDTIERMRARLDASDELHFLIGADAFGEIRTWRRWREVIAAVEFLVVSRPGHDYETPAGARVRRLEKLALDVSSSEIRRALSTPGAKVEAPDRVTRYIRERRLYGAAE
ncbi:MAG: nicotinate (nicotinamide) nucleotide adenylyltransferase [Vicinamibacterales bacterium]